jgi:hypothetical protein
VSTRRWIELIHGGDGGQRRVGLRNVHLRKSPGGVKRLKTTGN